MDLADSSGLTAKANLTRNPTAIFSQPTSQDIARDVLATPTASTFPSSNLVLGPLKQVLNGETTQTTPIQVSIVESMSKSICTVIFLNQWSLGKAAWFPRLFRFVLYMCFAAFCGLYLEFCVTYANIR